MFNKLFKFEKKIERRAAPYIDKLFYVGAALSPLIALPQIIKIYTTKSAIGVSLETWVLYFIGSLCMLVYASIHKEKPLIFLNLTVLPGYLLIIIGVILYS